MLVGLLPVRPTGDRDALPLLSRMRVSIFVRAC